METAKRVNLIMAFTGCQQCLAITVCVYVPVVPTVLLYSPKYSERHRSDTTGHGAMHALFAHGLRCSVLTLVLRNLDNPVSGCQVFLFFLFFPIFSGFLFFSYILTPFPIFFTKFLYFFKMLQIKCINVQYRALFSKTVNL